MKIIIICLSICYSFLSFGQRDSDLYQSIKDIETSKVYIVVGTDENGVSSEERRVLKVVEDEWSFGDYEKITHETFKSMSQTTENYFITIIGYSNLSTLSDHNFGANFGSTQYYVLFDKGITKEDQVDMYSSKKVGFSVGDDKSTQAILMDRIIKNKFHYTLVAAGLNYMPEDMGNLIIERAVSAQFTLISDMLQQKTGDLSVIAKSNVNYAKDKTLYLSKNGFTLEKAINKKPSLIDEVYEYPYEFVQPKTVKGKGMMAQMKEVMQEHSDDFSKEGLSIAIEIDYYQRKRFLKVHDIQSNKLVYSHELDDKGVGMFKVVEVKLDHLKMISDFFKANF